MVGHWVNSPAFFDPVQFPLNWMKFVGIWIEFDRKLNRNLMKTEQNLNRNRAEIERKLNGNLTEIEWKLRIDNESSVKGHFLVFNRMYRPGTLNWAFIVHSQFLFDFRKISVQFLFNIHSNYVQIPFNWIKIQWKLNRSKKADVLTHSTYVCNCKQKG